MQMTSSSLLEAFALVLQLLQFPQLSHNLKIMKLTPPFGRGISIYLGFLYLKAETFPPAGLDFRVW